MDLVLNTREPDFDGKVLPSDSLVCNGDCRVVRFVLGTGKANKIYIFTKTKGFVLYLQYDRCYIKQNIVVCGHTANCYLVAPVNTVSQIDG